MTMAKTDSDTLGTDSGVGIGQRDRLCVEEHLLSQQILFCFFILI